MLITREQFKTLKRAQLSGDLPTREELKKLSTWVAQSWLDPVISNLRFMGGNDKNLLLWLDLFRLDINSHIELEPEPVSYIDGEYSIVAVSICDIMKAQYCANIAALAGISTVESLEELFQKIGFAYGQDLAAAISKGQRPPWPSLDITQLGLSFEHVEGVREMSNRALVHYITWLILHEIGHHQLNHLSNDADNKQKSIHDFRQEEIDADLWAFKYMNTIAYSLPILKWFLLSLNMTEEIDTIAGQTIPESQSDHPRWSTRLGVLEDFIEHNMPTLSKWIYFGCAGMATDMRTGQQQFSKFELMIPGNPKEMGTVMGFYYVNGELTLVATEYVDGCAYLYARDVDTYLLLHMKKPFEFSSEVDIYMAGKENGFNRLKMERWSFSDILNEERSGLTMRSLMDLSALETMTHPIREIEENPDMSAEIEQLIAGFLADQGDIILRYNKGKISPQQFNTEWQNITAEAQDKLKAKLGDDKFEQYQKKIESNAAYQLGMTRWHEMSS